MLSTQVNESDSTTPNAPTGLYSSYKIVGDMLFISGQTTRIDGKVAVSGRLGQQLNVEQGQQAARICAKNVMAQANEACESKQAQIKSTVKLSIYLQTSEDFTQHAKVADGASGYLSDLLGEIGAHSRTTVGVASLPSGSTVEIDAIFELEKK